MIRCDARAVKISAHPISACFLSLYPSILSKPQALSLTEVFVMRQQNFSELQPCHVDDLKIPDFDERKTVQVAAFIGKKI